jgi:hypothetical protein
MRMILVLALTLALAGCAATGTPFKDHRAHTQPVPADQARVVVFRMDKAQGSTIAATMDIDGLVFGSLLENGFVWHDIDTATHLLRADVPTEIGTCLLTFQIAAGETGYFLVAPRAANAVAKTPGTIAQFITDALVQGAGILPHIATEAAIQAGATLDSVGKKCSGPFSVTRVLPAAAEPVLMELRESVK